jgi:5-dehydro-4-deoxyglucarate dehydratase
VRAVRDDAGRDDAVRDDPVRDDAVREGHAARDAARDEAGTPSFFFFNGMPTAEVTQRAYRAIGVPLYSSAAFAFAPQVALAYYDALEQDDQATLDALERAFYHPLARLRAKGTGYAVSLIKAGVELAGYPTGGVRPPLTAVTREHREELARILAAGLAAVPAPVNH